ncbi:MAG: hypothetical protein JWM57_299 [Phycisphaerales bacterium]|nr:hypothetical protein [Phycisphaerales bacterium]
MNRTRSAIGLVLLGILGGLFFWLTDPALGIATRLMDSSVNRIDAANQAAIGTYIGLAGSAVAVLVGMWSIWRRPA